MDQHSALRQQLVDNLKTSHAHAEFSKAIEDFPAELHGKRPKGSPHSPWELLEHMRIAQWDILEFSRSHEHRSPDWPSGYWPQSPEPPDSNAWDKSVKQFRDDLESFCALVSDQSTDLFARIPHGSGQTLLREALLLIDHNAYHLGQLVLARRLLGTWSED